MNKTTLKRISSAFAIAAISFSAMAAELPYKNPQLSIAERTEDLLARMTMEEKVAQLETVWKQRQDIDNQDGSFKVSAAKKLLPFGIGHIARPSEMRGPLTSVQFTNAVQKWLVEETRLGIPAIFHEEALHGHAASESTSFPQAIALASTWDAQLIYDVYKVSSEEVRARGGNQALTPILDVARDPRWGRIEETMGEDPYLITELGVAAVKGFQGESERIPGTRVLATLKHLTGHGQPTSGINIAPAPMGERELREIFLPPFEAAIKLGNARSVMASYNEIDGVPSHASKLLLTDILRDEWGFNGILVSDYFAINELITRHSLTDKKEEAAIIALDAGVDIEMPDRDVYPLLVNLVKSGKVSEAQINVAVKRVLGEKFRLGLFENPFTKEEGVAEFINNAQHQALALKTAEKAVVLLKNDKLLPLQAGAHKKVAVIGPHADETLLGGYSDVPRRTVTILDGIRAKLAGKAEVSYAQGTMITEILQDPSPASVEAKTFSKQRWNKNHTQLATPDDTKGMMEKAVQLAKDSDVAIVVVGSNEGTSREGWAEDHLGDRSSITLLGEQQALAEAIIATGTPVVLVLYNGRPLTIGKLNDSAPAIVEAWYLGQETGTALANILFGDVNPSGKLPVTFPRDIGQVPLFYNHKPSAKRGYIFADTSPQYPFGHGLSYTNFSYSSLKIDAKNARANGEVRLSFKLKNTGKVAGDEVVQLYVRDMAASTTRAVKELKGFKRVSLNPGESARVSFELPINMLALYDREMNFVVEPGDIQMMLGSSSADIRLEGNFEIKGEVTEIANYEKAFLSRARVER